MLLGFFVILLIPMAGQGQSSSSQLTVITYNLRSGQGYGELDGKTQQNLFSLIGASIGHYQPDLLIIQEPGDDVKAYEAMVAAMGNRYRYTVLKCPDYKENKRVGLLVYNNRIVINEIDHCIQGDDPEAGELFNHWARVSLNFVGQSFIVYGFKLAPREQSEKRKRQMDLLAPYVEKDLKQQRSVIIAGDLNHRPFDPEYARWKQLGMVDAYDSLIRGDGFTKMDELGDDILVPYRRIDYLLLSPNLAQRLSSPSRTLAEGMFVPHLLERRWSLSDHLPVMATFRIAESTQKK